MKFSRPFHALSAIWLGSSLLVLTACVMLAACGGRDESARAAPEADSTSTPPLTDPDDSHVDDDGDDGDDLARTLFGGIAAFMTGTGECVALAAAARHGSAARRLTETHPTSEQVPTPADPDSTRIALVPGLRVVYAVAKEDRDYESWVEVTGTDEAGLDLRMHSGGGLRGANRRVIRDDLDDARCFAMNYTGERRIGGPGLTWLSLSRALLSELRSAGEVEFGLANESVPNAPGYVTYVGPLRRVGTGTFTLMLDDSLVQLPSILARAEVHHGDAEKQVDLEFLDDLSLPLLLRSCCLRSSDHVVRIERRGERRIERALAETGEAIVYGIQFDFGSADLRDDSDAVLEEIADAMRAHPEWRLRIDGHTDAIGDAAANLELSRRRAAAVRDDLVRRLGPQAADRLETGGHGESRPRADNATLEGRAANRRVELIRSGR